MLGVATPLEVELAEAISRLVPSMESMRFVITGTEATMMALRVARAFTGKTRVGKFEGHYHGQHDGVLMSGVGHAVAGPDRAPEPVLDCAGLPPNVVDNVLMLPWNDPDATVALVRHYFTDRPILTRRNSLASDRAKDRAFALGLLAGGVYLAPAHPGFTSSAHDDADIALVVEVSERVLSEISAAS